MRTLLRIGWRMIKAGLFALGALAVLGVSVVVTAALLAHGRPRIADKSVLVFNLNTQITGRPVDERSTLLARLFGYRSSTLQLRAATTALREAAQDKHILDSAESFRAAGLPRPGGAGNLLQGGG